MKKLVLLLFFGLFGSEYYAQILHCGADEMQHHLFQTRPDLHAGIVRSSERLEAFTQAFHPTKTNATYIIPVVFHVIHNNGAENIAPSQILDALEQLNLQFRKLNPDTNEIVAPFAGIAADAEIEFRLAQLDPNGNCTSGITRTVSPLTYIGDHQVKSLIHWPREKYLNIYVCADAAGLAGHALMPAVADTIPAWDGIVMRHDYVGTIGTSDYFRRTVLSHEVGHFLNLFHIWGGNNVPNFYYLPVGDPGNCAYDDNVTDTPNTIGWSTCNLSSNSCSSLDNVQNYMDYAYCARMFTEGQKTRMHAALNSPVADRMNLWQPANLVATGTTGGSLLCAANFRATQRVVCVGQPFWLIDESYHGATSYNWITAGATVLSNNGDSIQISYPTSGIYDLGLEAGNGSITVDTLFSAYITVLQNTSNLYGVNEDFESTWNEISQKWLFPTATTLGTWEQASNGYNSAKSLWFNAFQYPSPQVHTLDTKTLNFAGWTSLAISFDWAYAQISPTNNDLFQIQLSTDCGETWSTRKTYTGLNSLQSYLDTLAMPFVPQSNADWAHDTVLINVPSLLTDHTRVRFRYECRGGNNFYLDNIRIGALTSLDIVSGVNPFDFNVFPNPATNEVVIVMHGVIGMGQIDLIDISGKRVRSVSTSKTEYTLPLNEIQAGIYFVEVNCNGIKTAKKIVVQ